MSVTNDVVRGDPWTLSSEFKVFGSVSLGGGLWLGELLPNPLDPNATGISGNRQIR